MAYRSTFSHWPIVVAEPSDSPGPGEVERYLRDVSLALGRQESHVVVLLTPQGSMTRNDRRQIAEWVQANTDGLRRYRRGLALVTRSRRARTVLELIYWLAPPPFPYAVFSDRESAMEWARSRLEPAESRPSGIDET